MIEYKISSENIRQTTTWKEWDNIRSNTFSEQLQLMFPFLIDVRYVSLFDISGGGFVFVLNDDDREKITWINLKL